MDYALAAEVLKLFGLPGIMLFVLILLYRQSVEERKEITDRYLSFLSEHMHKDLEADERIVVRLAEMSALQVHAEALRQQEHQLTIHTIEMMEQHLVDAIGKMTRREP